MKVLRRREAMGLTELHAKQGNGLTGRGPQSRFDAAQCTTFISDLHTEYPKRRLSGFMARGQA